jgi:hypothetical protein
MVVHFNMFLINKYTNWYFSIINNASLRKEQTGYTEVHHIIPKSLGGLGGKDTKNNLVRLTIKEHYIVHRLLTKMVEGKSKIKMLNAFWAMITTKTKKLNGKQFENMRIIASNIQSNSMKNKWNNPNSLYNSEKYRQKQAVVQKEVQNRPSVKQTIFEKRAEEYVIISPERKVSYIKGLSKFCRENNLHAGNMSWLANGKLKYYKGWQCKKV